MSLFSQFWRQEAWEGGVDTVGSFQGLWGRICPCSSPGFWWFVGHLWCYLACTYMNLISDFFTYHSLCVCVCILFPLHKDTLHTGLEVPSTPVRPHPRSTDNLCNGLISNFGLPWWLSPKESACNAWAVGDLGSIPRTGRPPGEGHGNPCQYSCLEKPTDREVWWATIHRVAKSQTELKWHSMHMCVGKHTHTHTHTHAHISK